MVLFEAANSMSILERCHSRLRRAVNIIRQEAADIEESSLLEISVRCINDSVGLEESVPTLLVFGALLRLGLPNDLTMSSTLKRAITLRIATEAMSRHFARREVRDALVTRNELDVLDISSKPMGSPALVYRCKKCMRERPFSLLDLHDEDTTVLLPPPSGVLCWSPISRLFMRSYLRCA